MKMAGPAELKQIRTIFRNIEDNNVLHMFEGVLIFPNRFTQKLKGRRNQVLLMIIKQIFLKSLWRISFSFMALITFSFWTCLHLFELVTSGSGETSWNTGLAEQRCAAVSHLWFTPSSFGQNLLWPVLMGKGLHITGSHSVAQCCTVAALGWICIFPQR
jgi:hypothetical protein